MANEVRKMEGKHPITLAVKVKLLLFLTFYFKSSLFWQTVVMLPFDDCNEHELSVYPPALFKSAI